MTYRISTWLLACLLLFLPQLHAQPFLGWAQTFGRPGDHAGMSVVVDAAGNLFTAGLFEDTVDLDPGPGTSLFAADSMSMFVRQFTPAGNLAWAVTLDSLFVRDMALDPWGNILLLGSFRGATPKDFDPGPGVFAMTAVGWVDMFVVKLDPTGQFVWARQIGGSGMDTGTFIDVDAVGNIVFTGQYDGPVDFDPGPGAFILPAGQAGQEGFITKLDSGGNFLWAKALATASPNAVVWIKGFDLDPQGGIRIAGQFSDTVTVGQVLTSMGNGDIFVARFDAAGNPVWANTYGTPDGEWASGLAVDQAGASYLTGFIQDKIYFGPVFLDPLHWEAFVLKVDTAGNVGWARNFPSIDLSVGMFVAVDGAANVYTTGQFFGQVDFDPGSGFDLIAGNGDVYVSKLDSAGNHQWAAATVSTPPMGSPSAFHHPWDIAVHDSGQVYSTGWFDAATDFDPGPGTAMHVAIHYDMYLWKLEQSCPLVTHFIADTVCASYTLNGQTYTASGHYVQTFPGPLGCDTVWTLDLVVHAPIAPPGAIIGADTVCAGQPLTYHAPFDPNAVAYTWVLPPGWTTTGAGTGDTIQVVAGTAGGLITAMAYNACGSSSAAPPLQVAVRQPPVANFFFSGANPVTFTDLSLGATSLAWDFGDGSTATGPNPVHAYPSPGIYQACLVATGQCGSDTACQSVSVPVGLDAGAPAASPYLYPNPTTGILHVYVAEPCRATLHDTQGRAVGTFAPSPAAHRLDLSAYPQGFYFLHLHGESTHAVLKLEKFE